MIFGGQDATGVAFACVQAAEGRCGWQTGAATTCGCQLGMGYQRWGQNKLCVPILGFQSVPDEVMGYQMFMVSFSGQKPVWDSNFAYHLIQTKCIREHQSTCMYMDKNVTSLVSTQLVDAPLSGPCLILWYQHLRFSILWER